jgi:hypothetical protein
MEDQQNGTNRSKRKDARDAQAQGTNSFLRFQRTVKRVSRVGGIELMWRTQSEFDTPRLSCSICGEVHRVCTRRAFSQADKRMVNFG